MRFWYDPAWVSRRLTGLSSLLVSSHLENQTFGRFASRLGGPNYLGVLLSPRSDHALFRGHGERSPGCPRKSRGRIPPVRKRKGVPQCRLQVALWELLWAPSREQAARGRTRRHRRYGGSVVREGGDICGRIEAEKTLGSGFRTRMWWVLLRLSGRLLPLLTHLGLDTRFRGDFT